jgi:ADP-heptose:LPS heptosyltransferase
MTVEPLGALPLELHGVDVAVNLHGRGPQSHRVLLTLRPVRLLGFRHHALPSTTGFPAWRTDEHEVARWCRMLSEHGVPADPTRLTLGSPLRPPAHAPAQSTVLHPGASSVARRWPVVRWAELAAALHERGDRVVVTGDASERSLARRVARLAGLPDERVLAGTTTVVELAGLVATAIRVVCGDTGVAHLATAFGTPSVVLFGPTPPTRWGPPPSLRHRVIWKGREGAPDGARPFSGLLDIAVDEVLDELDALDTPSLVQR